MATRAKLRRITKMEVRKTHIFESEFRSGWQTVLVGPVDIVPGVVSVFLLLSNALCSDTRMY